MSQLLPPEEKTIDGIDFMYQPLMLKQSRAMFDKLAQRFGPAVASAIEGLSEAQIDGDMELAQALGGVTQSAGGLIRGVVGALDPSYHAALADELAKQTQYRNESGNWVPLGDDVRQMMFGCRLLTETKLIAWCLGVQYSDFLAPLRRLAMQAVSLRGMAISALDSRQVSTGSPTESPPATNIPTA